MTTIDIALRRPHAEQQRFINSSAKRKVIRAGRRSGKTTGIATLAVRTLLDGGRVLYTTPTQEQVDAFWYECKRALRPMIDAGLLYVNETRHIIEVPRTKQRIRAKTAWNADSLRGDYGDLLVFDEYQLTNEEAWGVVGVPMLLDNDGDAIFIYTPPSLRSRSVSKARDPRHAAKLFKFAAADTTGRWETFHFSSHANPHISTAALDDISNDMTTLGYRQEILAEDIDEAPGALWSFAIIEAARIQIAPQLDRIIVSVDPAAKSKQSSDEMGIVTVGSVGAGRGAHCYVIEDRSRRCTPTAGATAAINAYIKYDAGLMLIEDNQGGEWLKTTINMVSDKMPDAPSINIKLKTATKSKGSRAEPVSALYEQGRVHHVGVFGELEDQMCSWVPGEGNSPDRVDALVHAVTELAIKKEVVCGFA